MTRNLLGREHKMRKNSLLALLVIAALGLSGCETLGGNKQTLGTIGGAAAGGLLGAQVGDGSGRLYAVGIGTLLGALVGSEVGSSLDKADMLYAQRANQQAHSAPLGKSINWNNPESGNSGTVTPTRDGYADSGEYCREYQQTIYVGGQQETGYGIACRQPDGTWKISG